MNQPLIHALRRLPGSHALLATAVLLVATLGGYGFAVRQNPHGHAAATYHYRLARIEGYFACQFGSQWAGYQKLTARVFGKMWRCRVYHQSYKQMERWRQCCRRQAWRLEHRSVTRPVVQSALDRRFRIGLACEYEVSTDGRSISFLAHPQDLPALGDFVKWLDQ